MFVKFLIHLTVLEILWKLVVDMCFCLQTCISAVVMAVVIGLVSLYNVLRSVGAHARNNFKRALNYAHPYGYKSAISFHSPKGALWRQWLSHGNCEHKALGSFRPASKLTEGCEQYGLGSALPPPLLYLWLTHCTMAPVTSCWVS